MKPALPFTSIALIAEPLKGSSGCQLAKGLPVASRGASGMYIRQTQLPLEYPLCTYSFFLESITSDYMPVVVSGGCLVLPTALDGRLMEGRAM